MVTKNKIPANWPAALKMADDIAELIREFKSRHGDVSLRSPWQEDVMLVLDEIEKMVGAKDE
jgi:hypothetical protein